MTEQVGDILSIRTADGNTLVLVNDYVKLLAYGNLGAPDTQYITRRGYLQDGSTEIDYTLSPRTISAELWRSNACDRQTYWDYRKELHDFLRPNRNGALTFTLQTPNGNQRSIIVRADPGLTFPSQANDNSWNIKEQFDFIAFNPLFFNATQSVVTLSSAVQTQLVFPITFSISFGTSDIYLTTGLITYQGTWETFPIITLTGPYTRAVITNQQTGAMITMSVAILAGESRIIDLTPGSQSITDSSGNNKFSDLGVGANLVGFVIAPDPEVAGGIQEITVQLVNGTNGVSTATISYYERYFAL